MAGGGGELLRQGLKHVGREPRVTAAAAEEGDGLVHHPREGADLNATGGGGGRAFWCWPRLLCGDHSGGGGSIRRKRTRRWWVPVHLHAVRLLLHRPLE